MGVELDADGLRAALSSAGLGAFAIDADQTVIRLDAQCASLLALETRQVELDRFLACVHADDRQHLQQSLSGIATHGEAEGDLHQELEWTPDKDGVARRMELRGRVTFDADGRPVRLCGTMRDITGQRRLEQGREQSIEELTRTVLFSEMFVGILAHDLRNPLSGIMVAAQLAARTSKEPPVVELVTRIRRSGERVERMIGQLLDFSCARVGSGIPLHLAPADLMTIARDVLAELEAAHPGHAVSLEGVGDSAGSWDSDRLAQVLSNLIGNALEHGVVAQGVQVRIDGTKPDRVVVSVCNQGLVPPELIPILFNPFRASHHHRKGSRGLGLGLYITRQISVAHGGDVELVSTSPEGTMFRVSLPRRAPTQPTPTPAVPDEMLALERFAGPGRATAVTAQLFGVVALHDRAPRAYWQIFERYGVLLDQLVQRRAFKETAAEVAEFSGDVRAMADRLGELNAGAREVADLHARAIRARTRGVPIVKSQALIAEGRLMSFELMGHLLSFYRRRAGFRAPGATAK